MEHYCASLHYSAAPHSSSSHSEMHQSSEVTVSKLWVTDSLIVRYEQGDLLFFRLEWVRR
jgi:hypothetical protein